MSYKKNNKYTKPEIEKDKFVNFYNRNGFIVVKVFNKNEINILKNMIKKKADKIIRNRNWNLPDYHKHISSENNKQITKNYKRYISVSNDIINNIRVNKKIIKVLKNNWNHANFIIPDQKYLIAKSQTTTIKKIKKNEVQFRIVIPRKKNKSNSAAPPPHVDLNAAKVTKKMINGKKFMDTVAVQLTLWTPLVGFSKKYTLRFAPGSHLYNHPINKIAKNNKNYVSPVFEEKYYKKFKYKRINLKKGEAILFDGNLIHGGTENLGSKSRVNLEFRLYNYKNINLVK